MESNHDDPRDKNKKQEFPPSGPTRPDSEIRDPKPGQPEIEEDEDDDLFNDEPPARNEYQDDEDDDLIDEEDQYN